MKRMVSFNSFTTGIPSSDRSGLKGFGQLLGWITVCNAAGAVGAVFTGDDREEWYSTLNKPSFNPPDGVFGPVWTVLYTLMGIAGFLTWRSRGSEQDRQRAVTLFSIQLVLNALWTFIFFEMRSPRAALIEIVMLLVAIVLTMRALFKLSTVAGMLLIPYLIWVGFATLLNLRISQLNR